MLSKQSFILHLDSLQILKKMSNEQAGIFIKTILEFQEKGQILELDLLTEIAITPFINQFKRDDEKWQKVNLYIIKLSSSDEKFIKIGITSNLKKRFQSFRKFYQVKLVDSLFFDNRIDALLKEAELHKLFYPFRYIPLKNFGGKYECFSIKILEKYVK